MTTIVAAPVMTVMVMVVNASFMLVFFTATKILESVAPSTEKPFDSNKNGDTKHEFFLKRL